MGWWEVIAASEPSLWDLSGCLSQQISFGGISRKLSTSLGTAWIVAQGRCCANIGGLQYRFEHLLKVLCTQLTEHVFKTSIIVAQTMVSSTFSTLTLHVELSTEVYTCYYSRCTFQSISRQPTIIETYCSSLNTLNVSNKYLCISLALIKDSLYVFQTYIASTHGCIFCMQHPVGIFAMNR